MLCTNPAANWVLAYWCIRTAEELHSVFRPLLVWSSMGFWASRKTELMNCLFIQVHMFKCCYFKKIEILHHHLSETPEQIHKRPCLIYHPGRDLDAKNFPRTDGSRRAQQLKISRTKEGEPTLAVRVSPACWELWSDSSLQVLNSKGLCQVIFELSF